MILKDYGIHEGRRAIEEKSFVKTLLTEKKETLLRKKRGGRRGF